jgi:transcription initiation factor TFIIH subunit 1
MAELAPIPEHIMNQVLSCHNAACEFLRQFWSAVLPNLPGTLGAPTAQQKADKARKMADYLGKTGEKVEAVVRTAVSSGMSEPERVREVRRDIRDPLGA